MVTRKVKKKNRSMIGLNGSGVGPYDVEAFMKYEPIPSTPEEHLKHHYLSPLSFLMHNHSHTNTPQTHRKSKTLITGINSIKDNGGQGRRGSTKIQQALQQDGSMTDYRRRNTTGDVLLHSESISLDSEDTVKTGKEGSSEDSLISNRGDSTSTATTVKVRRMSRRSVSQSDMTPLRRHTLTPPGAAIHHIQHYPSDLGLPPQQYSNHSSSSHSSHHKKHMGGSTTRGNGGEHLPMGFSDNVFELLEQVLTEVALVNQRY